VSDADATLTVLRPGAYTLVVDGGRPRCRSLGVPVGGAADRAALAVGNALVGNPDDTAALEVALLGPVLRADRPLACVLFGAPFDLRTDRRRLAAGTTFTLQPGEELHVGGTAVGMRAYLCVRGGLQTSVILGSRSSLAPLAAGAELPCRPGEIAGRSLGSSVGAGPISLPRKPPFLFAISGPQADWFPGGAPKGSFTVTNDCNRMGLRLKGDPLPWPGREMVSEPVCPGSVQVTPDGQCIILGVDGQTIGGYPKIAQVVTGHLDALGQYRPGDQFALCLLKLEEAEKFCGADRAHMRRWAARIRAAGPPGS
jgi:5-oxoprolinase (ATP-hydrolysing) subunit C